MDPNEELIGADLMEHRINHTSVRSRTFFYNSSLKLPQLADWNFSSTFCLSSFESGAKGIHESTEDRSQSGPRQLHWRHSKCKASHETKIQIWFRLFFKASNQHYSDWSTVEKSASNKASRKSQKRKTSFSIRNDLLPKRKGSRSIPYDNHAIEEDRSSIQSGFRGGRQVIPTDRDSIMNARNDSTIPSISSRVSKSTDPNFAWID